MTFFEILNKIAFKKGSPPEVLDYDSGQAFQPFLLNRYIAFHSPRMATFVNETFNRYTGLLDDKNDLYKLYYNLVPRCSGSFIKYISKKKKVDKAKTVAEIEEETNINILARSLMISKREVAMHLDFINSQTK